MRGRMAVLGDRRGRPAGAGRARNKRVEASMNVRLAVAGVVAGVVSAAAALLFSAAVDALAALYQGSTYVVWLLPFAGLATLWLYYVLKIPFATGTKSVLADIDENRHAPLQLALAIFVGTCLTIVAGGSVGKEAAALQMAAAISPAIGKLFGLRDPRSLRLLALCGMASSLAVLLGTPLMAAVFVFELFRPRRETLRSIVIVLAATLLSELIAYATSADYLVFDVVMPGLSLGLVARVAVLIVLGALLGALFCWLLEHGRSFVQSRTHPAVWLVACGVVYAALITLLGCYDVAGTGMSQNTASLSGAMTEPFFALKLLLTALLLSSGYKGGEIMPTLCIGATLGCFLGYVSGGDAAFLAALGMVVLFAACTNCPLASVLLGVEAFGIEGILWYVVAAALAYALTSHVSLYGNIGIAREWPLLKRKREVAEEQRRRDEAAAAAMAAGGIEDENDLPDDLEPAQPVGAGEDGGEVGCGAGGGPTEETAGRGSGLPTADESRSL